MLLFGLTCVMFCWLSGLNEGVAESEFNTTEISEDEAYREVKAEPMYVAFYPANVYGLPPKPQSFSQQSFSYKPPAGVLLAPPVPQVGTLLAPSPRIPSACNVTS
uniref:Uncharacterized protein n=1 Tax=Rhodnius prolixus TaxID=13249 RepID=T1I8X3_RHOPR